MGRRIGTVVLTSHTGANDFVQPGRSGTVVPIRDPAAIANALLEWAERVMQSDQPPQRLFDATALSFARFESDFIGQLHQRLGAPG